MSNEHVVVPIEIVYAGRSFVPSGAGGGNIDYSQYYTVENGAFTQFDGAGLDKAINGEDEIDGKKMYIGVETRVPVDGVSVVAKKAFEDNPFIRSVRIPEGVTTIGVAAFAGSQLREVTLPDSLLEIGLRGFNACPNLRHVILPKNLKKISSRAFNMCKGLETVRSAPDAGDLDIENSAFSFSTLKIFDFSSVVNIGNRAFGASWLEHLLWGGKIKTIGVSAFSGCQYLTVVRRLWSLKSIGREAFEGCRALKEVELPNTLTSLGENVFKGCSGLEKITVPAQFVDQLKAEGLPEGCNIVEI